MNFLETCSVAFIFPASSLSPRTFLMWWSDKQRSRFSLTRLRTSLAFPTRSPVTPTRHEYDSRVESWVDSESNVFRLSHGLIWIEKWGSTLSHDESIWINACGIPLSHELILSHFLETRLSHELNWFKSSRYCLSHELIRIRALEPNVPRKVNEI